MMKGEGGRKWRRVLERDTMEGIESKTKSVPAPHQIGIDPLIALMAYINIH
jgi:hypothetical protein